MLVNSIHKKILRLVMFCCVAFTLLGCGGNSGSSGEPFSIYKQEPMEGVELQLIIDYAKIAQGAPYKWGGDTLSGFDSSGLIQWIFRKMGHGVFRNGAYVLPEITAHNLYYFNSKPVENIGQMQRGYLIFFDENSDGHITHNSIFDRIDEQGNIWVYDAYSITGLVEHRIVKNFWQKGPIFGQPLKTVYR